MKPNGTCHECGRPLTRNRKTALFCSMRCKWLYRIEA